MDTKIVQIDRGQVDERVLDEAAALIESGGLVVFPTETVYGIACAVSPGSLKRLDEVKVREEGKRYSLHIGDKGAVLEYVPGLNGRMRSFIDKCWPGPVTIVFELDKAGLKKQKHVFEKEVFDILYEGGTIGIRCIDDEIGAALIERVQQPVLAPSANPAGERPAVEGWEAARYFEGKIEMILDAGKCREGINSTVVKISGDNIDILRSGAVGDEEIRKMATVRIMFVCTGNTCRSPMAEYFCRKYLSEKFDCGIDEVEKFGYKIISSGVSGLNGMPASPEVIEICGQEGIDARGHRSSGLDRDMIRESDYIFVMGAGHLESILSAEPGSEEKVMPLDECGDIPDPIGAGVETYRKCAERIETALEKRLSEIL